MSLIDARAWLRALHMWRAAIKLVPVASAGAGTGSLLWSPGSIARSVHPLA
jgi:hypothetical protein